MTRTNSIFSASTYEYDSIVKRVELEQAEQLERAKKLYDLIDGKHTYLKELIKELMNLESLIEHEIKNMISQAAQTGNLGSLKFATTALVQKYPLKFEHAKFLLGIAKNMTKNGYYQGASICIGKAKTIGYNIQSERPSQEIKSKCRVEEQEPPEVNDPIEELFNEAEKLSKENKQQQVKANHVSTGRKMGTTIGLGLEGTGLGVGVTGTLMLFSPFVLVGAGLIGVGLIFGLIGLTLTIACSPSSAPEVSTPVRAI